MPTSHTSKVLWKEGMFLQPQHFQQTERFVIGRMNTVVGIACRYAYGFAGHCIDTDALANESFAFREASGIMPDGTPFDMPDVDSVPAARELAGHLSHQEQAADVYLALPLIAANRANVGEPSERSTTRYRSSTVSASDEVLGGRERGIEVGDLNYSILFGDEVRDGYSSMPACRLGRNGSGQIVSDPAFIPPILRVDASQELLARVRGLLDLLLARSGALSQERKQLPGGLAEPSGSGQAAFHLLYTVNTYASLLNHFYLRPSVHPHELFGLLLEFAGALCTFSSEIGLRDLPAYDHDNPAEVFCSLDRIVRRVLEAEVTGGCVVLPVRQEGPSTCSCRIAERSLLTHGRLFLEVAAAVDEKELVVGTLSRIKVCPAARMEALISSSMPGVPLVHVPGPPVGLPTRPGAVYFRLGLEGEFRDEIALNGMVGIYFPHQFPDFKMTMFALRG